MRWIFISPHFDDAVLSCGGLIYDLAKKQIPVEIWTVFAGEAQPGPLSPLAMSCHQQWGFTSAEEVVEARRIENQDAASEVGADTLNLSIPDCIYRRSLKGELLYPEDVFVPIHPFEKDLDFNIAAALSNELQPDDKIVGPLAIGGHVDHVLTRRAVECLERPFSYYADIPYLLNQPETLAKTTTGFTATFTKISKVGLTHWKNSISAYRSQIWMLFETREKMHAAITQYWEGSQGIRLWHKD
jgi:LmbE family N-acetylglucosaminyl deacetylase